MALRRRSANGRGQTPAHDSRGWSLRQNADEPEWRADPAGGPLEIRIQEHQVDRPHPLRGQTAGDLVEPFQSAGVWLLLEREPAGRSSALDTGARTADWHLPPACDADVQRLC